MPILNCVRSLAFSIDMALSPADIERVIAERKSQVLVIAARHMEMRARSVTAGECGVVSCCDESKNSPVGIHCAPSFVEP